MNPPTTAREALLIEALGEVSELLERLETLVPVLDAGARGVLDANSQLAAQLSGIEGRMVTFAEAARRHAIQHIAQRTEQAARHSIDLHRKAMDEAARALFVKELGPALQALVLPLQRAQDAVLQNVRPWDTWLTHAASAVAAAIGTWLLTSGVWRP